MNAWTHEASIDTCATSERISMLFADVARWPAWNAGIESIALHGPFATGSTFTMRLPDGNAFESTLVEVDQGIGFVDETTVGVVRVRVAHRMKTLSGGDTRIPYATDVAGADADAVGTMVAADFASVLAALERRTEGLTSGGSEKDRA